jgi:hypothetical protein
MDLDLWLKIARNFRFVKSPSLLSASLVHSNAKTNAFRYLTWIDTAFVILRQGGENEARKILEDIGQKLTYYESNYKLITDHPFLKLVRPLIRMCWRNRTTWDQVVPGWSNKK